MAPARVAPARVAVLLGVTALTLAAGLTLKAPCATNSWVGRFEYRRLCYNDIQPLYYARHLDERRVPYATEFNEYPVLTGTHMYLTALGTASDRSYFARNAVVLIIAALFAALVIAAASGWSWTALMFAGAPSLALYAFHNWDVLAVLGLGAGLWLWRRERVGWAGAAFGAGAAAKLFPAAALLTGVVALLRDGRRRDAARFAGAFGGVMVLANLPYALANPGLWWRTYSFHAGRFPDYGTVWFWGWRALDGPETDTWQALADQSGAAVLVVAAGAAAALQLKRRLPMAAATALIVVTFLFVTKVHSPQYALWLLPFFAVVPGLVWLFPAYEIVDLTLYVSGFRWISQPVFDADTGWSRIFSAAVVARALLLVAIAVHCARIRDPAGSPQGAGRERRQACPRGRPAPSPPSAAR